MPEDPRERLVLQLVFAMFATAALALVMTVALGGCATRTSPTTPSTRFAMVETMDGFCEPMWFSDGLIWDAKQLIIECRSNQGLPVYITGTSQQSSVLSNAAGPLGDAASSVVVAPPIP